MSKSIAECWDEFKSKLELTKRDPATGEMLRLAFFAGAHSAIAEATIAEKPERYLVDATEECTAFVDEILQRRLGSVQ